MDRRALTLRRFEIEGETDDDTVAFGCCKCSSQLMAEAFKREPGKVA